MLRISFIKKYKLKEDFYFSNTHLFFYDKLEKALNRIVNLLTSMNNKLQDIENAIKKQKK